MMFGGDSWLDCGCEGLSGQIWGILPQEGKMPQSQFQPGEQKESRERNQRNKFGWS